jgi:uncharacterized damage-inducible protein DinB
MNADELLRHWRAVRRGLYAALDQLDDEQLAFVPREGMWSLGTVARHIANAEEGWFRYVAARELDEGPPFVVEEPATVESIKGLLAEVHDRTETYLRAVADADLNRAITAQWGETLTLQWILWHVLEHEIHHRGEIYLMLGLMGMEAPDV